MVYHLILCGESVVTVPAVEVWVFTSVEDAPMKSHNYVLYLICQKFPQHCL